MRTATSATATIIRRTVNRTWGHPMAHSCHVWSLITRPTTRHTPDSDCPRHRWFGLRAVLSPRLSGEKADCRISAPVRIVNHGFRQRLPQILDSGFGDLGPHER